MSRQFTTPVLLLADPAVALGAATKQYVDLRELQSNKGAVSGYCGLDSSARVPAANMPIVEDVSVAASITTTTAVTLDASQGNLRNITATANVTLNAPTSPVDGQQLRVNVLASGAIRTVTFSGVLLTTGITLGPYSVPSGAVGLFLLTYTALRATPAWYLVAAAVGTT